MTLSDIAAVAKERDYIRGRLFWIGINVLTGHASRTEVNALIDALPCSGVGVSA